MSSRRSRKILHPDKRMDNYSIIQLVGQGGYGDIYQARDIETNEIVALKVETIAIKKQALLRELEFMKKLASPYFPHFYTFGQTPKYRYIAMEMCGPSFSAIRRIMPNHKFTMSTSLRCGIEMIRAIRAFHQLGFLHRDIKPSNFLIRASRKYPLALIDYGLSRPYIDEETQEMIPPRTSPGFVGTAKYASLRAHDGKELGRRDDLYSWFYSLLEMMTGHLPWPSCRDKQKMYEAKKHADISSYISDLPCQIRQVYYLIKRYNRDDEPNYNLLISFLVDAMHTVDASWDDSFDWEIIDSSEISPIPLTPPDDEKPIIPTNLPPPVLPSHKFAPLNRNADLTRVRRRAGDTERRSALGGRLIIQHY